MKHLNTRRGRRAPRRKHPSNRTPNHISALRCTRERRLGVRAAQAAREEFEALERFLRGLGSGRFNPFPGSAT